MPAATRGASVQIEPLGGRSSDATSSTRKVRTRSGSKGDSRVQPSAVSPQQKPKRSRSSRKKAVSGVKSAAAAVDPFPAASASGVVGPLTGDGGSDGGGGGARTSSRATAEAMATVENRATAAAAPGTKRKSGSKATAVRGRATAVGRAGRHGGRSGRSSSSSSSATTSKPKPPKPRYGDLSAKRAKALRTGGRAFFIVCDAESITFPELLESIDILDELGTRDVGVVYADWEKARVRGVHLG